MQCTSIFFQFHLSTYPPPPLKTLSNPNNLNIAKNLLKNIQISDPLKQYALLFFGFVSLTSHMKYLLKARLNILLFLSEKKRFSNNRKSYFNISSRVFKLFFWHLKDVNQILYSDDIFDEKYFRIIKGKMSTTRDIHLKVYYVSDSRENLCFYEYYLIYFGSVCRRQCTMI